MNYLVVFEEGGEMLWFATLPQMIVAIHSAGPCTVYELQLTRRQRPRFVLVDPLLRIPAVVR